MHASALFELSKMLTALHSCGWGTAYLTPSSLLSRLCSLWTLLSGLWLHNPLLYGFTLVSGRIYGIRHPTVPPRWG